MSAVAASVRQTRQAADAAVTATSRQEEEAERALLGALLLDAKAWSAVAGSVAAADFGRADHRLIFGAIEAIVARNMHADGVTLVDYLHQIGQLEAAGGRQYIAQLLENSASAANVANYARLVREHSGSRALIALGREIAQRAAAGEALGEVARFAHKTVVSLMGILEAPQPLSLEAVSEWAGRPAPQPRDWVVDRLIPSGRVTSALGNGGLGKTTIALQIGLHVAMNRPIFGVPVKGGRVIGFFCEDEQDELERRVRAACAGEQIELANAEQFFPISRDGQDNLLCTFERDQIVLTPFYAELEATVTAIRPRLLILDTAADLFAGDFMSTPQVRQFIKVALNGLCVRHGCAILLLAHPSASGMSTGEGGGFSTAWHNSVRSRLFLRRPKSKDMEETKDRRVLEVKKSNYAEDGGLIPLIYQNGYFVPDPAPIDETNSEQPEKAPPRLAFAALNFMRARAPHGMAVRFADILEEMQRVGEIVAGTKPEAARKQLNRALSQLVASQQIRRSDVPKGCYAVIARPTP